MVKYALIVAGGKGLRMGGQLPKQFIPIGDGKPVLMHTINAFQGYDSKIQIIVVLPPEQQNYWRQLCIEHSFWVPHLVVDGGETRFHSVRNGLSHIDSDGFVGVHDGVRPFVAREVIARCYEAVKVNRAVAPAIELVESLRQVTEAGSRAVNRSNFRLIQTPQVFDVKLLKNAYAQKFDASFTDDASVVEAMGIPVCLVEGNRENIKITTPFDLKVASVLI